MERVWGVDFHRHSKLIEPASDRFSFRQWNVTEPPETPLPPADVAVAMEILEHVEIDKVAGAVARIRGLSRSGTVLVTVPYRERPPLYHHDKPHGHKQSFDDARIKAVFGPRALVSDYAKKWYFVMLSDIVDEYCMLAMGPFQAACRSVVSHAISAP
jgi:hypothetical protein